MTAVGRVVEGYIEERAEVSDKSSRSVHAISSLHAQNIAQTFVVRSSVAECETLCVINFTESGCRRSAVQASARSLVAILRLHEARLPWVSEPGHLACFLEYVGASSACSPSFLSMEHV